MEKFSLILSNKYGKYDLLDIDNEELEIVLDAYKHGKENFTINGVKRSLKGCSYIKVYKNQSNKTYKEFLDKAAELIKRRQATTSVYITGDAFFGFNLTERFFIEKGGAEDLTKEFIGNIGYGDLKEEKMAMAVAEKEPDFYIDESIIDEIRKLPTDKFEFKRLVKLLEELNDNYNRENLYSVAFLLRAIIDHIPPVFNKQNFASLANQNAFGSSNKKLVSHLQDFSRNVSDREIHSPISTSSIIITPIEIDFKASLSALLRELINASR